MNSSKRSFLAVTVVWVVSTYKDRQEEFAATVESALNKARQKEMDDHFSASGHNGITVTVIGTDSTKEPLMFPKDILSHNAKHMASITVYKLSGISPETGERLAAITEPTDSATGFETVSFLAAFYDRINNLGSFPNSSITIAVKATDTDTRTGRHQTLCRLHGSGGKPRYRLPAPNERHHRKYLPDSRDTVLLVHLSAAYRIPPEDTRRDTP